MTVKEARRGTARAELKQSWGVDICRGTKRKTKKKKLSLGFGEREGKREVSRLIDG